MITKYYCTICGKFLGVEPDVSEIECPGKKASLSMGAYYDRRDHYQYVHGMDTDDARYKALYCGIKKSTD